MKPIKLFLAFATFLFLFPVYGNSFVAQSKIDGEEHFDIKSFSNQAACESFYNESCAKVPFPYNPAYHRLADEMAGDCGVIGNFLGAVGIVTDECIATGRKIVVVDEDLKAAYDLEQAQKAQLEASINLAQKQMSWGQRVIALMSVKNAQKDLSGPQIAEMLSTYATIESLLRTGALDTAKTQIAALVADGTLVTEQDKTDLIAEIEKFTP